MNAPIELPDGRLISREAEQLVLGALLMDNDAIDRLGDLRAEHFYVHEHRAIFAAIQRLIMQSKPADVLTVSDFLKCQGSDVGDFVYLNAIVSNTPSAANIGRYAEIVRDRAVKRAMVALGKDIADQAEHSAKDASVLVDELSSRLEEMAQANVKREPMLAADCLVPHIESIDERYHGNGVKAIPTGFADLDAKLNGGLRRGQVIVLAARPKMGKTALALNIACNVAKRHSALVCSMEMPISELHDRNLASLGHMPLPHLLDPAKLQDEDWPKLTSAVQKIRDLQLYLDDQGGCTLMDIRMKAKQVKRRYGLDLLVIDYLQLMNGEGDNRNAQIEGITRGLKALGKELDIAVLLLSQLNRELERRPNKRPQPSDLRDSGSIEQDADVVIFLYRDEVYHPDTTEKGICEVDVALNRSGSPGRVALTYIGEQTRFESMVFGWKPPMPMKETRNWKGGFNDD
jgi:replicative DNA helicase